MIQTPDEVAGEVVGSGSKADPLAVRSVMEIRHDLKFEFPDVKSDRRTPKEKEWDREKEEEGVKKEFVAAQRALAVADNMAVPHVGIILWGGLFCGGVLLVKRHDGKSCDCT